MLSVDGLLRRDSLRSVDITLNYEGSTDNGLYKRPIEKEKIKNTSPSPVSGRPSAC